MGDSAGFGREVPRSPRPENGESRDQILLQLEPDVPDCKGMISYIINTSVT